MRKIYFAATVALVFAVVAVWFAMGSDNRGVVSMSMVSRSREKDLIEVVIALTNRGPSIRYCGYSKTSPLFSWVENSASGLQTNSPGWCGTGLREQTLAAGDGLTFKAFFIPTRQTEGFVIHYTEARPFARIFARLPTVVPSRFKKLDKQSVAYVSLR